MAKDTILILRGELNWAKLTGSARPYTGNPKYDKGPYWSCDLTPDAESRAKIKAAGIEGKLRQPKEGDFRKESFLSLKVLENRSDGAKNDPPRITDVRGVKWDGGLLGNGTVADLKVKVVDYGSGSEKGVYLQATRILQHVAYESTDFAPLSEEDKYFAGGEEGGTAQPDSAGESPTADELDDDIPF